MASMARLIVATAILYIPNCSEGWKAHRKITINNGGAEKDLTTEFTGPTSEEKAA